MEKKKYKVARSYIKYRYDREKDRAVKNDLERRAHEVLSLVNGENEEAIKENSNKDTRILSTMRDYIAGFTCKDIASKKLIPQDIIDAHNEGLIHFHE
jgi:ribonucleoside-triphosphate reductase